MKHIALNQGLNLLREQGCNSIPPKVTTANNFQALVKDHLRTTPGQKMSFVTFKTEIHTLEGKTLMLSLQKVQRRSINYLT